jgi:preprotein translocase SecE subunit
VARNRKRAKERPARQPQAVASGLGDDDAPEPLAHAAPDAELAAAQLALGRPELTEAEADADSDADYNEQEYEAEVDESLDDGAGGDGAATALERAGEAPAPAAARKQPLGGRIIGFLQGSWRELQRVQWPDRRQTMQATGVVIGFVIVAAVFLGVADVLSQHVMNYVLEGHW